jgi:TPR repeat protein
LLDAAKGGSVAAAAHLADLYSGAYKARPRLDEALRWRRIAAENGHLGALYALTAALLKSGDPAQEKEAAQWLERAAAQGHAASQFELAVLYCTGKGVEKNLAQAVGWYEKAAQEGHVTAKHNLGVMLINGMGVEADPARGARLVQEAGAGSS